MSKFSPLLLVFLLLASGSSYAQISAEHLPSIGSLEGLLGSVDVEEVESSVYDSRGKISINFPAPDTARGETANTIATILANGSEENAIALEKAFLAEREIFEKYLADANFDPNDMGVALSASFIVLWELASNKILPAEASLSAGKRLVHAFGDLEKSLASVPDSDKAKMYDWLMTTPVAFSGLIKTFENEGQQEYATQLRTKSGDMFEELFILPYDMLVITDTGEVTVDVERIQSDQKEKEAAGEADDALSSDW